MTLKGLNGSTNLRSRQDRNALHESFSGGVAPLNHRLLSAIPIGMEVAQLSMLYNPNLLTAQP